LDTSSGSNSHRRLGRHRGLSRSHGDRVYLGVLISKKILFSLKGIDLNDDDALEAFTTQVWEHVTGEPSLLQIA